MSNDLTKNINELSIDLKAIADTNIRQCIVDLLNIIQQQAQQIIELEEENYRLKDEIARLKGQQGRPNIKPNKSKENTDHSSEKRRKKKKSRKSRHKKDKIEIDRAVFCPVDPAILPEDAQYKGVEEKIVQEVIFRRDNIAFKREKFYSPSLNKTFLGPLPTGFEGYRFGPGIRSLVVSLYFATDASEPKILELLASRGIQISAGELSNLLIYDIDKFHQERTEIRKAGLASSLWQQIDDTSTRIDGVNHYCHILCNPFYVVYQTTPSKDRPTVLSVLRGTETPRFLINDEAVELAADLGVKSEAISMFRELKPWNEELDKADFDSVFAAGMASIKKGTKRKLYEAAALAAYQAQTEAPVVHTLLGDDARQFDDITNERALCWIHEGRHYAKLKPVIPLFQEQLETFQDRFWDYYHTLLDYKKTPSPERAIQLDKQFDELLSTKVDYEDLSSRISKTREKKTELLLVLSHPELPLHNNESELGARRRVRKRDVSLGPRTSAGAKAWDSMQSVLGTAKKLGIGIYKYIEDRITGSGLVPKLSDIIDAKANELKLSASWSTDPPLLI